MAAAIKLECPKCVLFVKMSIAAILDFVKISYQTQVMFRIIRHRCILPNKFGGSRIYGSKFIVLNLRDGGSRHFGFRNKIIFDLTSN